MAPNEKIIAQQAQDNQMKQKEEFEPLKNIVWRNVILFFYLHCAAIFGFYLLFVKAKGLTIAWVYVLIILNSHGITAGAHRLWAHRSYQARFPLRIYLCMANAMGFQNSIYEWSRDHRAHHKFSETDGDPHNAKRGFFFSHMGWLLARKHPEVRAKGGTIDLTDLEADPIVMFQHKYYLAFVIIFAIIMPATIPYWLWDENFLRAVFICGLARLLFSLHVTWLVNSAAHLYGVKPYDKKINPADNILVSVLAMGEGFHNYHHTFPWDYGASEWGWERNLTKFFIDFWAVLGLAYDLKRVPKEIVDKRRKINGDGSTPWYEKQLPMISLNEELKGE